MKENMERAGGGQSSGYCSPPAALLSARNMFRGGFSPFPRLGPAADPTTGPAKVTPPASSGRGKRVLQGRGSPALGGCWQPVERGCGMLGEEPQWEKGGRNRSLGAGVTRVDAEGGQADGVQGVITSFLVFLFPRVFFPLSPGLGLAVPLFPIPALSLSHPAVPLQLFQHLE